MIVQVGVEGLRPEWPGAVVGIGTFDGVHRGHRAVLKDLVREARAAGLPAVVITFDRHPAAVLAPDQCPPALATLDENLRDIAACGVDVAIVLPFTRELSELSADVFFRSILLDRLRVRRMVVGHDFALGHDRRGNAEWLGDRIDTVVVPPLEVNGARVSSTEIRQWVAEGDVARAAEVWGRVPTVSGVVVGGQRLGRTLGYPTANLGRTGVGIVPGDGVYAGWAEGPFGHLRAAISIGCRPVVQGEDRTIEGYLLDYDGPEFYGAALRYGFCERLRPELPFPSLDDLVVQMGQDVAQTRELVRLPSRVSS